MSALTFADVAQGLADNGYRPVPISPGTKAPPMKGWTSFRLNPMHLKLYPTHGCGVITGGAVGVDIDVLTDSAAEEIEELAIARFGRGLLRIGKAPKRLLMYRMEVPIKKTSTPLYTVDGEDAKVEVLADGQQFVAYATHPDTGKPYDWPGASPLDVPLSSLPAITAEEIAAFLADAEGVLGRYGQRKGTPNGTPSAPGAGQLRTPLATVEAALEFIPNGDCDYDRWWRVGAALKGSCGEAARDLFLAWSAQSSKDVPAYTMSAWRGFKPTTLGGQTIIGMARDAGWRPDASIEFDANREEAEAVVDISAFMQGSTAPRYADGRSATVTEMPRMTFAEARAKAQEGKRARPEEKPEPEPEIEEAPEPKAEEPADIPPNIDMELWRSSMELSAIRDYSHSRYASADAVLGDLFALISANLTPGTSIKTLLHPKTVPNFFSAIVGSPEAGKTHAAEVASEIFGALVSCDEAPIGTGQGMAEAFMDDVNEGGKKPVKKQVRHNVLFTADEGAALIGLLAAKDFDLATTLCKAFNGKTLGRKNATTETTRIVTNYRMGLQINIQPHLISALVQHAGMGLMARFAFFSAHDPSATDARCAADVSLPRIRSLDVGQVKACKAAYDEGHKRRLQGLRGTVNAEEMEQHYMIMLHKMAFYLMIIEGRCEMEDRDWERAKKHLWPASCGVRDFAIDRAAVLRDAEVIEQGNLYAVRKKTADSYEPRINALVARIARHLKKHPSASERDIRRAVVNSKRGEGPLFADAMARFCRG